ncbi:hypothetical protein [Bremerella sp. P1]|uniref:hypothetical protein n=1 Tax=Bremerella sp. P1 TaxID=3026424 RepID=UPI0023685801|nr:hypothetical protein [Bremerella sp. P1]WDI41380.1 hypothetical protein PSR63_23200 [Bremerella sp. P1]
MLTSAVAINQFQLAGFQKIAADVPDAALYQPAAGHQHLPVWVMGHLALTGEMGVQALGGSLTHPDWMPLFAPGSSGEVPVETGLTKQTLIDAVTSAYTQLQKMALEDATPELLAQPHGIGLFDGSPIQNVGDVITLLLTNHFGFHLAQLSSCRREAGFAPLF